MLERCLHVPALAGALLLGVASGIRPCEQERLENMQMETHGENTNKALKEVGLDGIYIVHYTKYTDRKEHMKEWLTQRGLQGHFITGYDREVATDEDVKCMWPTNAFFEKVALRRHFDASWLEVRELTLAMKHASAWYAAAKNKHRNILVVEDDAMFARNFVDIIRSILTNETARSAFGVLHLGSFTPDKPGQRYYLGPDGTNRGGVGYLLSLEGAEHMMSQNPILTGTADHMLSNGGFYPNPPKRRWVYRPWPVWQGTRQRNPVFSKDASNRFYCWTPDMGPCKGVLCFLSPKFASDFMIIEGIIPTYDSVMFENSTALSREQSHAMALSAEASRTPQPGPSLRRPRSEVMAEKREAGFTEG